MRQGARIWIFLGLFGVAAAVAFGLLTIDIVQGASGTVMLGVFGVSMLYIAWVLHHGRHTDPTDQPDAEAFVGPEHIFPPSWAPPLLALGIAMFVCGVRFTPVLLAIGGVIVVMTLFTWIVQRIDVVRMLHAQHPELFDSSVSTDPSPGARLAGPAPGDEHVGSRQLGHDNV